MTREEVVEIIKIERECVERNTSNKCDRDCINCDLLRADEEIFSAYDMAIATLQEPEIVHCKQCKYRGTSDCAMRYECMCGEQHSWETDIDYCSWGEKAGEQE